MTPRMRQMLAARGELQDQRRPAEKFWQAARVLRQFDVAELASVTELPANTARRWMRDLIRYGYLRQIAPAAAALIRDTGPQPPQIKRHCRVAIDRNLNQEFSCLH